MKLWQMLTCICPDGGRCVCLWMYIHKNHMSTPLRTLYSLTSTVSTLLEQFPKDRCVSILWTSKACHPHWSLYSVGSTALLIPEALTTTNLMIQAHIICHLLNHLLPFLLLPLLKMYVFLMILSLALTTFLFPLSENRFILKVLQDQLWS